MLSRYQFEVLKSCSAGGALTQRDMAMNAGISLGSVNKAFNELLTLGYLDEDRALTAKGTSALAPYRVDNAVILAAGAATRFAPLSFERPKAMFEVRGEILIERQIRQLREAGIDDVSVVVGYMKEAFFYLEDEFGVKIIVNPDYATRNNHSSLWCAKELLGNTYILCSDEYYTQNVFSLYNFESYASAVLVDATKKMVLDVDGKNRILGIGAGGVDAYQLRGPAYIDREFARRYLKILEEEYDRPETVGKLWEQIFGDHATELHMVMRAPEADTIREFDYLTDLVAFDSDFFANVDSRILDNICETLDCAREEISDVTPIKAGLTNLSTFFTAKGVKYIYRHPGNGTNEIINRRAEAHALKVAAELGLDDTFVHEDPDEGWKISRFIDGCSELDYSDRAQVARALQMVRTLHTSGATSPWSFDFFDEGMKIAKTLADIHYPLPRDFDSLADQIGSIAAQMRTSAGEPVLCHNDFYGPNLLVRGDEMRLIDWEYAAMGDPMCDIGNFIAQGSGYLVEETLDILPLYFGREATEAEKGHCLAAVALVGWYWYVWAMYKAAMGNPVGDWLYIWYRAAKEYSEAVRLRVTAR